MGSTSSVERSHECHDVRVGGSSASVSGSNLSPADELNLSASLDRAAAMFGRAVSILMRSSEYQKLPIEALGNLLGPAITNGQIAIVDAKAKANEVITPAALLTWAKVSKEDDIVLSDGAQTKRPEAARWSTGDIVWLVDAAGDPKMLTALIARLRTNQFKGCTVKYRARAEGGGREVRSFEN